MLSLTTLAAAALAYFAFASPSYLYPSADCIETPPRQTVQQDMVLKQPIVHIANPSMLPPCGYKGTAGQFKHLISCAEGHAAANIYLGPGTVVYSCPLKNGYLYGSYLVDLYEGFAPRELAITSPDDARNLIGFGRLQVQAIRTDE